MTAITVKNKKTKEKRLRDCPETLGKMMALWNVLEREKVEEFMPGFLQNALTVVRQNQLSEVERIPSAALQLSLNVGQWIRSLPEEIRAWLTFFAGEFPTESKYIPASMIIRLPTGEYALDPDYKDSGPRQPTLKELMDWCTAVLALVILLQRSHQIASDIVETGESQPTTYWTVSSSFKPDSKGRLRYAPSNAEGVLQDIFEGVEAARIKRCVVCKEFFWAGRLDQTACSQKCASLHRVRTYRSKHSTKKGGNQNEED